MNTPHYASPRDSWPLRPVVVPFSHFQHLYFDGGHLAAAAVESPCNMAWASSPLNNLRAPRFSAFSPVSPLMARTSPIFSEVSEESAGGKQERDSFQNCSQRACSFQNCSLQNCSLRDSGLEDSFISDHSPRRSPDSPEKGRYSHYLSFNDGRNLNFFSTFVPFLLVEQRFLQPLSPLTKETAVNSSRKNGRPSKGLKVTSPRKLRPLLSKGASPASPQSPSIPPSPPQQTHLPPQQFGQLPSLPARNMLLALINTANNEQEPFPCEKTKKQQNTSDTSDTFEVSDMSDMIVSDMSEASRDEGPSRKRLKQNVVAVVAPPSVVTSPKVVAPPLQNQTLPAHSAVGGKEGEGVPARSQPHECPVCGRYFQYPRSLLTHQLVHQDVRPHKCPVPLCNKAFRQTGHLQTHLLIHSGDKPFRCPAEGCTTLPFRHANRRCPVHADLRLKKIFAPVAEKPLDLSVATLPDSSVVTSPRVRLREPDEMTSQAAMALLHFASTPVSRESFSVPVTKT